MKTKNKSGKRGASVKKKRKKKIIVTSVAVGAAGILGYFGWQYLQKRKQISKGEDIDSVLKTINTSSVSTPLVASKIQKSKNASKTSYSPPTAQPTSSASSGFPLKKGSRGSNVRLLQEALIAMYGKSALPKYGADGDFGSETVNALKKAGLPESISESSFNVLVQSIKLNAASLGKELYGATVAKNYTKALSLLKKITSVEDYSAANNFFKEGRINGVRQTIVNGLLGTFKSEAQKQEIKFEFLRFGLQFDGNKWSLSGFDGKSIVTTENTTVWISAVEGVKVPAKMVLGNEVSKRLDYTLFENKGKYFLVNTRSVQYLN